MTLTFCGRDPGTFVLLQRRPKFRQVVEVSIRNFGSITGEWEFEKHLNNDSTYYISHMVVSTNTTTCVLFDVLYHPSIPLPGWMISKCLPTYLLKYIRPTNRGQQFSKQVTNQDKQQQMASSPRPPSVLLQSNHKLTRAHRQHSEANKAFGASLHIHLHTSPVR